jgi:N-acetylneuraminic acid mutarotase
MVRQATLMSRINAIIATILLLVATATAQVPETMSFQGELGTGVTPNSTQTLTFRIYNSATGGTALWYESHSVSLDIRRFSVVLGSSSALNLEFDAQYWVGVTVGSGTELSPRVKLTSAPYSLRSRDADMAETVADGAITTGKIANGAVTDTKVASGISYSKLSGAPTSLPPNGSAGGDLSGSYPNPTIADAAVTTDKIADEAVTDEKISDVAWGKITGAPTSLSPGGSAGGDLSGSYPNPGIASDAVTSGKIADGAITDADISSSAGIAYSKLSGAPESLPPNGTAGGDLDGNYPNPMIADGAVTDAKVASGISYSKLSGAPTSLPPDGSAGGDLTGSYPNPAIASDAVTSGKIADATITDTDISATAAIAYSKLNLSGSIQEGDIVNSAVTSGKITDGTITDSDISATAAIAYSKLSGVPSSLPPNGNAGGDLTGSYPNPTIASDAVTGEKIDDGTITDADVSETAGIAYSKLSGAPTSLPPDGAAGGDLTGNYPNPLIATGAVTSAKIADGTIGAGDLANEAVTNSKIASGISYSKLSGAPTSLPPSGNAGGDLGSTYPNPTVAKIQGRSVSSTAPANGQALKWNSTSSQWEPGASDNVPAGLMLLSNSPTPPSGYTYTGMTVLSQAGDTWATKSSTGFTGRTSLAAAAVNGKIYAIGGASGGGAATLNEEYDPATNSWSTKASMPTARAGHAAVAVNEKIYAIGGATTTYLNANEEYDPSANSWATKSSTGFTARGSFVAVAVNGKIYAIGGRDSITRSTNEEYNPSTNAWSTKTSMPTARSGLAAAAVNGKIYALGGSSTTGSVSLNEEYDPATNTWSTKSSTGFSRRSGFAAAAVNGKIYALGGNGAFSDYQNTNEEYNPATDTWTTRSSIGFSGRWMHAVAEVNGKIYVLGGMASGPSNINQEYTPPTTMYVLVKQ